MSTFANCGYPEPEKMHHCDDETVAKHVIITDEKDSKDNKNENENNCNTQASQNNNENKENTRKNDNNDNNNNDNDENDEKKAASDDSKLEWGDSDSNDVFRVPTLIWMRYANNHFQ